MKRQAFLFAAALLAAGPNLSHAQDADVVAGAVDPYDIGGERVRFLAAAGVDSELSEEEFKANTSASEPFARKYDSWTTLRAYDRNGNGTLDWFEADGYRKALREAVLQAYDKDKSGKLNDEELATANKDLAAGKTPRLNLPRRERPDSDGGDRPGAPGTPGDGRGPGGLTEAQRAEITKKYDKDGDGQLNDDERREARTAMIEEWRKANPEAAARFDERRAEDDKRRAEFTKKYDKDGNGELSEEERRAGFRAEEESRRAEFTKKYDKDGNGELSEEERREGFRAEGQARMDAWKERDPEGFARFEKQRAEFTKRFDKDGNGELSDEERRAGFETMREEGRAKFDELRKKYDKDGDGELSREEREELFRNERENLQGFFGPGGPGGFDGRGGRGPGGRGGDNGGNNSQPRGNNL